MTGRGAGLRGLARAVVPRRTRARVWRALRTTSGVGPVTRALETRLRRPTGTPAATGVPAGAGLAGPGSAGTVDEVPVVLLLALGLDEASCRGWLEEVAVAQVSTAGFRPLWLVDGPFLRLVHAYGWACDHVLTAEDLRAQDPDASHADHVRERVALWRGRHPDAAVVPLVGVPDAGVAARSALHAALTVRPQRPWSRSSSR